MAAILLIVAYFGFKDLTEKPRVWFDDGLIMQLAKNLAVSGRYGVELAPNQFTSYPYYITVGYPVILPAALMFKIFGATLWAARCTSVLFMLIMVASFYYLAKSLFGRFSAAMSSLLLVAFPPLYGNGKAFLGEVPGLMYLFLSIIFWQKGHRSEKKNAYIYYALGGLLAGLSLASKPSFFLLIPGFILFLFLEYLEHIGKYWRRFWCWVAGFFAAIGAWVIVTVPRPYTLAGLREVFEYYFNSYAQTGFAENVSANISRLFTDGSAIFFMMLFAVVAIGFFADVYRKTISIEALPLYIFVILTFLWWLKTPGWYRYFFPAEIVMFLFFPGSLKTILKTLLGEYFGGVVLYGLGLVSMVIFQFYWLIFKSYSPTSSATWVTEILNDTFKNAPEIFVLNSPEFAFGIKNNNFSQYFYYNPAHALGENALLRSEEKLPPVVVYNLKNVEKDILPQVQQIIDWHYKTYVFEGSNMIMVLKNYASY